MEPAEEAANLSRPCKEMHSIPIHSHRKTLSLSLSLPPFFRSFSYISLSLCLSL